MKIPFLYISAVLLFCLTLNLWSEIEISEIEKALKSNKIKLTEIHTYKNDNLSKILYFGRDSQFKRNALFQNPKKSYLWIQVEPLSNNHLDKIKDLIYLLFLCSSKRDKYLRESS